MKRFSRVVSEEIRKMDIEIKTLILERNDALAGLELFDDATNATNIVPMLYVEETKFKSTNILNTKIRKNSKNPIVSVGATSITPREITKDETSSTKPTFEMHKNGKHFKVSRLIMKEGRLIEDYTSLSIRKILEERGSEEPGREGKRITKRMIQRGIAVQGKFLVPIGEGIKFFGQDSPQVSKFYLNRFDALLKYIGLEK